MRRTAFIVAVGWILLYVALRVGYGWGFGDGLSAGQDAYAKRLAVCEAGMRACADTLKGCDRDAEGMRDAAIEIYEDCHVRAFPARVSPKLAETAKQIDAQLRAEPHEGP